MSVLDTGMDEKKRTTILPQPVFVFVMKDMAS